MRITNLNAALRALRQLTPDAHAELKDAAGRIADRVASQARSSAPGTRQAQGAAGTLRARRGDTPTVALGSAAKPYAMGAEFGGQRRPTTQHFPPWRGAGAGAGYFLWPTVRALDKWIGDEYADALDEALETAARRGSP
jgi:hypothetical protein